MPDKKVSILLLGLGGNVTQGILKAIRTSAIPCRLIGACVAADAPGLYFCDKACLSPYAMDDKFIPWLEQICKDEHIELVLTGVEENLEAIAANLTRLENSTNAKFLVCSSRQLQIGRDKLETCRWLRDNGLPFPDFCIPDNYDELKRFAEKHSFRLLAKPRFGKGSKGIILIRKDTDLHMLLNLENYIIQEEIGNPDDEYTVGCYQRKNCAIHCIAMKRTLMGGTTNAAIISNNQSVIQAAKEICKNFSPIGPLNIQMRMDAKGSPICFELNVRFSGTTPIRAHFGFRDVEAAIKEYALDESAVDCFSVHAGMALRFWEELYIDESQYDALRKGKSLENPMDFATLSSYFSSGQNHASSW